MRGKKRLSFKKEERIQKRIKAGLGGGGGGGGKTNFLTNSQREGRTAIRNRNDGSPYPREGGKCKYIYAALRDQEIHARDPQDDLLQLQGPRPSIWY